jgi:hypothetical protein
MRLIKSTIVGLLTAAVAGALAIALQLQLSLGAATYRGPGITGGDDTVAFGTQIEAVSISLGPAIVVTLVAGIGGFVWQWRRSRRSAAPGTA